MVYRLNEPKVVSETLDGETIVINLDTGSYFSLNPVASLVWNLLIDRYTQPAIVSAVCSRFDVSADVAAAVIEPFLAKLAADGLIVPAEGPGRSDGIGQGGAPLGRFEAPLAERYDDMRELLLADPIHDVSNAGWPHLPSA